MVSKDSRNMAKGKRTKRWRLSPHVMAVTSLSTDGHDANLPSPSTYAEFYVMEEEDMELANCLMLLAHGRNHDHPMSTSQSEESTTAKSGSYTYECKTCNRDFLSFQALGGHRASHQKPKALEEENAALDDIVSRHKKSRIHECSICGSKFSSGQALGGHMRRHRLTFPESRETNLDKIKQLLDLNLPAPADDVDFLTSPLGNRPLGFVAKSLIDCHN